MPHTKTAWKRMRQDAKRRLRNLAVRSELKTLSKKLYKLFAQKVEGESSESEPAAERGKSSLPTDQARELARTLVKKLDKAATRGIIPRQRANRKKSRIALLLARHKIRPV